jgi:hypothetical protein
MKKNKFKKLSINKSTLKNLQPISTEKIKGGATGTCTQAGNQCETMTTCRLCTPPKDTI